MPHNLELKIKVDSHTKLINLLKKIEAEYKGMLIQKDVYFKVRKGLLKLRVERGTYTLIKYLRDEKENGGVTMSYLNWKERTPRNTCGIY